MTEHPRSERETQNRIVKLFTDQDHPGYLGYKYLGNWQRRENNRPVEVEYLRSNLNRRGYSEALISGAVQKLETAADATGLHLYEVNMRIYQLLRYGVPVQTAPGKTHKTVHLIDWENPEKNDFGLAEEVTLKGGYKRRPDLVLYINGIAVGVIELKRSSVEIADGIRQLRSNQEKIFNKGFFSTVQFVFAGNDSQGLHYGTTGTPAKYFLVWKTDNGPDSKKGFLLDRPLAEMCGKFRFLDLIRNCVIFDAGMKKVPRQHQYIGFTKARERIGKGEGGVIWHTQGSGKSILMVMLAKWLLEHDPEGRVLIVTDRDELDKQIEGVMKNAGVVGENSPSPRATDRREFEKKLAAPLPRLICALLHKFNPDLTVPPPPVKGRFYIFVDECHRSEGGNMNRQMKKWMENAIFIGFTGTPLLRRDKKTTREVFGSNIHTYKFDEAVSDGVVLDLKYEARNVPQRLSSKKEIDEWFKETTKCLNNYQQAVLRQRWATMEELMSSEDRKGRIVASIIHDFRVRPRLNNNRGNAILVAQSIYDACHYFRIFHSKSFGPHCGIITSFEPKPSAIATEPRDSDERYKFDTYTQYVLADGQSTKAYEDRTKERFVKEPANCKLLIVVSKLLTGFDAPSCTYLYLDGKMKDHTLFQAICRPNRLDGEDKDYGYIVDFKELYEEVQESMAVYTSDELDVDTDGKDGNVTVKNWLEEGKKKLEEAREALGYICDQVDPPRGVEEFILYFCGDSRNPDALAEKEPLRISFYKASVAFLRAYAAIAPDLDRAGYTEEEISRLREEAAHYTEMRSAIKRTSGEELDIKQFEGDMRHLINNYIPADNAEGIGNLSSLSLTELIVKTGIHDAIAKKLNAKGGMSRNAVAESIINNVRKTIIRDQLTDPRFYNKMSKLLEDLIKQQRDDAKAYAKFLEKAEALVRKMADKEKGNYPDILKGKPEAIILYKNLGTIPATVFQCPDDKETKARIALELDTAMRTQAPAGWKSDIDGPKGSQILNAIYDIMAKDSEATMAIFEIIKNQPGY